jgi:hypothetical protein
MLVLKTDDGTENLAILREQVKIAFLESERENEERVLRIKKSMLNQTVTSILQAEVQNDKMINEMINLIPQINELVDNAAEAAHALSELSSDFASKLV